MSIQTGVAMSAARAPDGGTDDVISVSGLVKRYGTFEAVRGTSWAVHRGEIFGLLGSNGAGKTTSIEILEGYRSRDGGEISVLGRDPAHADRAWRNRIGLVLQDSELDPIHTVRETVTMFSRYYTDPRPVDATIELVGLGAKRDALVGSLSGGQRRRVDVALGIVGSPELLFLDEPTTGFDPRARREFWDMLEGLRHTGTTMVLTTHYMDEAQHLTDRSAIMRRGEIVAEGSLDDLTKGLGGTVVRFVLPHQASVDAIASVAEAPAKLAGTKVELSVGDEAQPALSRLLTWADGSKVALDELEVVRPTLDDVFMDLTADAATTEGGAS